MEIQLKKFSLRLNWDEKNVAIIWDVCDLQYIHPIWRTLFRNPKTLPPLFSFSIRIESAPLRRHLNRKRVTKVAISVGDVYCLRRGCSAFRTRVNIYLDFDLHLSERLKKEVGKKLLCRLTGINYFNRSDNLLLTLTEAVDICNVRSASF